MAGPPPATTGVPGADRSDRAGTLHSLLPATGSLYRLSPAGRHESRSEVGQRREDEQTRCRSRMRDFEDLGRLRRVRIRIDRSRCRWALDVDASPPEHEQVEIELTRAPALARPAPEVALERLERGQQSDRAAFRVRQGGDVECDHCVAELGLVGDADRLGRVEPGNATEPRASQRGERSNRLGQRRLGIADVRPETDIRADRSLGHAASIGLRESGRRGGPR